MALSAAGPVAVSAAHFLASLIFLRNLPAHEFGLFSFVMVVVSFGMSLNVSLIVVPITRNLVTGEAGAAPDLLPDELAGLRAASPPAVRGAAGRRRAAAGSRPAGRCSRGVFTFRWFARCFAYVDGRMAAAIRSDLAYSAAADRDRWALLALTPSRQLHPGQRDAAAVGAGGAGAVRHSLSCATQFAALQRQSARLLADLPRPDPLVADGRGADRSDGQRPCLSGHLHFRPRRLSRCWRWACC